MKQEVQRHPWRQKRKQKQKKMDDKLIFIPKSKSYLVESFVLNSESRVVSRKGKGRKPDPAFRKGSSPLHQLSLVMGASGRKVKSVDLETLVLHFDNYVKVVNMILERIYSNPNRVQQLGKKLKDYRGRVYSYLKTERDISYQHNDDFKALLYERLHRNALEQAGRMFLSDWVRRQLVLTAVDTLDSSSDEVLKLLVGRRIPSGLIRKVRDDCEAVKNTGKGYHHALGALRQLRAVFDSHILAFLNIKISRRGGQRKKVAFLLKESKKKGDVLVQIASVLCSWVKDGYPFNVPKLRGYSLDFSASTENTPSQGYWFTLDPERENEILLHLKLPPFIDGRRSGSSPYKSNTLTFRFLNWLPRAASKDESKVKAAEEEGRVHRAEQLTFRAAKFRDMHQQLMNTVRLQHLKYKYLRLKNRKYADVEEIFRLQKENAKLKDSRRSAPPTIVLRGKKVTLHIPFLSPNGEVSSSVLGEKEYDSLAGVDRGLRVPVALSVKRGDSYKDLFVVVRSLVEKRERLKKRAYKLTSQIARKKNNWEKKRPDVQFPAPILKLDRQISALWTKIRRLDREVAHQVGSQTVWFCEAHNVRKVYFEDLRSFQSRAGMNDLSWSLAVNLWGRIIEVVRYMRESLGHSRYSVWTVNPAYTSQTCHQCGERGIRVKDEGSTSERKGGEFFFCSRCDEHFHADINAARNIIHVQHPSVVPGGTV